VDDGGAGGAADERVTLALLSLPVIRVSVFGGMLAPGALARLKVLRTEMPSRPLPVTSFLATVLKSACGPSMRTPMSSLKTGSPVTHVPR
jgi:hypothetical protein